MLTSCLLPTMTHRAPPVGADGSRFLTAPIPPDMVGTHVSRAKTRSRR
jgi:hypothetical protein